MKTLATGKKAALTGKRRAAGKLAVLHLDLVVASAAAPAALPVLARDSCLHWIEDQYR